MAAGTRDHAKALRDETAAVLAPMGLRLSELAGAAENVGCTAIVGTHIPTEKNRLVQDLFGDLGFAKVADEDGVPTWRLDLTGQEPTANEFIEVIDRGDYRDA